MDSLRFFIVDRGSSQVDHGNKGRGGMILEIVALCGSTQVDFIENKKSYPWYRSIKEKCVTLITRYSLVFFPLNSPP